MSSWKFIIDADFNGEVIADYESEGSIKSVDNNMTITTILTMMKMLKMSVAVSDSDSYDSDNFENVAKVDENICLKIKQ